MVLNRSVIRKVAESFGDEWFNVADFTNRAKQMKVRNIDQPSSVGKKLSICPFLEKEWSFFKDERSMTTRPRRKYRFKGD
jgi:hypothetical protein